MLSGTKNRYLKQRITRYAFTGYNGDGMPQRSATGETVYCRIDSKQKKIYDKEGNEVVSEAQIIIPGDQEFSIEDKIVFDDGSTPRILGVEEVCGPDGSVYYKVIYT